MVLARRREDAASVAGPPVTADYRASWGGLPAWMSQGTYPAMLFHLDIVEAMMEDPTMALGVSLIETPIIRHEGQWRVVAESPQIEAFVDATLRRFWTRSIRSSLTCVRFGYAGGEALYEIDDSGMMRYVGLKPLHQNDIEAGRDKATGLFGGLIVKGGTTPKALLAAKGPRPAKGFWVYHGSEYNNFYGRTRFQTAYAPWRDKNGTDGTLDIIRMWYYKNAYSGLVIRYPEKAMRVEDGRYIPARDMARQTAEQLKTGGVAALPSTVNPRTGRPEWEIDWPRMNGSAEGLLDYLEVQDRQILRGLLIPDDVIAGSGGYSNRKVSEDAFYTMEEDLLHAIAVPLDEQIISPLVEFNFGKGDKYEILWAPMLPARQQLDAVQQAGSAARGGGNPEATGSPLADLLAGAAGGASPAQTPTPVAAPGGGAVALSLAERERRARIRFAQGEEEGGDFGRDPSPPSVEWKKYRVEPRGEKYVTSGPKGGIHADHESKYEAEHRLGSEIAANSPALNKIEHLGSLPASVMYPGWSYASDPTVHFFKDKDGVTWAVTHGDNRGWYKVGNTERLDSLLQNSPMKGEPGAWAQRVVGDAASEGASPGKGEAGTAEEEAALVKSHHAADPQRVEEVARKVMEPSPYDSPELSQAKKVLERHLEKGDVPKEQLDQAASLLKGEVADALAAQGPPSSVTSPTPERLKAPAADALRRRQAEKGIQSSREAELQRRREEAASQPGASFTEEALPIPRPVMKKSAEELPAPVPATVGPVPRGRPGARVERGLPVTPGVGTEQAPVAPKPELPRSEKTLGRQTSEAMRALQEAKLKAAGRLPEGELPGASTVEAPVQESGAVAEVAARPVVGPQKPVKGPRIVADPNAPKRDPKAKAMDRPRVRILGREQVQKVGEQPPPKATAEESAAARKARIPEVTPEYFQARHGEVDPSLLEKKKQMVAALDIPEVTPEYLDSLRGKIDPDLMRKNPAEYRRLRQEFARAAQAMKRQEEAHQKELAAAPEALPADASKPEPVPEGLPDAVVEGWRAKKVGEKGVSQKEWEEGLKKLLAVDTEKLHPEDKKLLAGQLSRYLEIPNTSTVLGGVPGEGAARIRLKDGREFIAVGGGRVLDAQGKEYVFKGEDLHEVGAEPEKPPEPKPPEPKVETPEEKALKEKARADLKVPSHMQVESAFGDGTAFLVDSAGEKYGATKDEPGVFYHEETGTKVEGNDFDANGKLKPEASDRMEKARAAQKAQAAQQKAQAKPVEAPSKSKVGVGGKKTQVATPEESQSDPVAAAMKNAKVAQEEAEADQKAPGAGKKLKEKPNKVGDEAKKKMEDMGLTGSQQMGLMIFMMALPFLFGRRGGALGTLLMAGIGYLLYQKFADDKAKEEAETKRQEVVSRLPDQEEVASEAPRPGPKPREAGPSEVPPVRMALDTPEMPWRVDESGKLMVDRGRLLEMYGQSMELLNHMAHTVDPHGEFDHNFSHAVPRDLKELFRGEE